MSRSGFKLEPWRKPTPGKKFSPLKIAHETVAFIRVFVGILQTAPAYHANKRARNFLCTKQTLTNFLIILQVNYVKTIDKYLIGCFLFVFASLVEYSIVLFLAARMKIYQESDEYKKDNCKKVDTDPSSFKFLNHGGGVVFNRVTILPLKS